jgi:hypothetical protein
MQLRHAVVLLLTGCASQTAPGPSEFDLSRDPGCTRQCLQGYNGCVGNIGASDNRIVVRDVMTTCQANTRACIATCPR